MKYVLLLILVSFQFVMAERFRDFDDDSLFRNLPPPISQCDRCQGGCVNNFDLAFRLCGMQSPADIGACYDKILLDYTNCLQRCQTANGNKDCSNSYGDLESLIDWIGKKYPSKVK